MSTKIEWTDETWSPTTGCSPVSEGCANCWAKSMAKRFWGDRKFGDVQCHSERLEQPLHWREPRKIAVSLMGDLFHEAVPFEFILKIFGISMVTPWHTYLLLTKRIDRVLLFFKWWHEQWIKNPILWGEDALALEAVENMPTNLERANQYWLDNFDQSKRGKLDYPIPYPQPNIWLGVSVENQKAADERIPILLQIPAAVRFVSVEPMLEKVDLRIMQCINCEQWIEGPLADCSDCKKLDWVIVGCESGQKRRECKIEWIQDLANQCKNKGILSVPLFVKQLSINGKVSHNPEEWPEDLRLREYPMPKENRDGRKSKIRRSEKVYQSSIDRS